MELASKHPPAVSRVLRALAWRGSDHGPSLLSEAPPPLREPPSPAGPRGRGELACFTLSSSSADGPDTSETLTMTNHRPQRHRNHIMTVITRWLCDVLSGRGWPPCRQGQMPEPQLGLEGACREGPATLGVSSALKGPSWGVGDGVAPAGRRGGFPWLPRQTDSRAFISQFQRPDVQNQGVGGAGSSSALGGEPCPAPQPAAVAGLGVPSRRTHRRPPLRILCPSMAFGPTETQHDIVLP